MNVPLSLTTNRLLLESLSLNDKEFIYELVNTQGWIKFIGNRNINSHDDAFKYIQKILASRNIFYWVVKLENSNDKIGVVTLIKRTYLEHRDIGFAFLPAFMGNGYAYEAAYALLHKLFHEHKFNYILATTIPANVASISLLKKLGLKFEKEIEIEQEKLYVFGLDLNNSEYK